MILQKARGYSPLSTCDHVSSIAGVAPAPFLEGRSDTLIGAFTAANAHSDYSGACHEARAA